MKLIINAFLIITFFSSCVSTNKSSISTPMSSPQVQTNPIKADIDIDMSKKLKGSAHASYLFNFRVSPFSQKYLDNVYYSGVSMPMDLTILNPMTLLFTIIHGGMDAVSNKVKAAAAYNAIEGENVDILVHPEYVVEKKDFFIFKKFYAEVTGYKGTFKNIEQTKD